MPSPKNLGRLWKNSKFRIEKMRRHKKAGQYAEAWSEIERAEVYFLINANDVMLIECLDMCWRVRDELAKRFEPPKPDPGIWWGEPGFSQRIHPRYFGRWTRRVAVHAGSERFFGGCSIAHRLYDAIDAFMRSRIVERLERQGSFRAPDAEAWCILAGLHKHGRLYPNGCPKCLEWHRESVERRRVPHVQRTAKERAHMAVDTVRAMIQESESHGKQSKEIAFQAIREPPIRRVGRDAPIVRRRAGKGPRKRVKSS